MSDKDVVSKENSLLESHTLTVDSLMIETSAHVSQRKPRNGLKFVGKIKIPIHRYAVDVINYEIRNL